jgi:hypothetical protein
MVKKLSRHRRLWYDGFLAASSLPPPRSDAMDNAVDRVIVTLNSLQVGAVDRILIRLDEAQSALQDLAEEELVATLAEARVAIRSGDVPLFRKRVQHVVSRLGHRR